MPKKPAKKVVKRTPRKDASQVAMSVVLQATGLSELKPVKPTRKSPAKKRG
jgi:hypothetical protein